MEKLVIAWTPEHGDCDWLILDRNGNRVGAISRGAGLDSLPGGDRQVVWLLPGTQALSVSASLPVKGRDKLQRALPYALEERFAEDPEELFFALASTQPGEPVQAFALERERFAEGLARLRQHGADPERVLPDYLALPWTPGEWTVLTDAGMLYVRQGRSAGFTMESDAGWTVLRARFEALAGDERPQRIRCIRGREPHGPIPDLEGLESDPEPVSEGLLGVVPEALAGAAPDVELLQGPFGRRQSWIPWLRPWLPAAAALAAVVLLGLTGFTASWVQAAQANTRLERELRAHFHRVLPGARWQGQSMARAEIRQRLQQGAGQSGSSGLLAALGAVANAGTGKVRIQSFSYQAGTLQLQVHAPDVSTLDDLRSAVSGQGIHATVQAANQTKSGVDGTLKLEAAGGGAS